MPLLVAPLVEDPRGVSWSRETLLLREAVRAGLGQHPMLMD